MKKLLGYIIQNLVKYPDKVKIEEEKPAPDFTNISLTVDPQDMSLVIGKQGRIIKAIRNIIKIKAILAKQKFNLKLTEQY